MAWRWTHCRESSHWDSLSLFLNQAVCCQPHLLVVLYIISLPLCSTLIINTKLPECCGLPYMKWALSECLGHLIPTKQSNKKDVKTKSNQKNWRRTLHIHQRKKINTDDISIFQHLCPKHMVTKLCKRNSFKAKITKYFSCNYTWRLQYLIPTNGQVLETKTKQKYSS